MSDCATPSAGAGFFTDNIEAQPIIDFAHYHSTGGRFSGAGAKMDEMLNEANRECDVKKQQQRVPDFQRYEGGEFFQPRLAGGNPCRISWPAMRNKGVCQDSLLRWLATNWLDPSRPPLNR